MLKINEKCEVEVAQVINTSPEQLQSIINLLQAAKQRANPGEVIWVKAGPRLYFYHDPKILRGDLERTTALSMPPSAETKQLEILDTEEPRTLTN